MKVSYYPGCSLHATGKEYDQSVKAVSDALGIELQEVDDWSCCGASSAHLTNFMLSVALPARNIIAAQSPVGYWAKDDMIDMGTFGRNIQALAKYLGYLRAE